MNKRDAHIRERLAALIEQTGTDMSHLSKQVLGRNHAYVFQYLNQETPKRLSDEFVERLARFFGIDPSELAPGFVSSATHNVGEPATSIDAQLLADAIVSARVQLRMRGADISVHDEAEIIAAIYKELATARQARK